MLSVWTSGPPTERAAQDFSESKHKRAINGRDYMRYSMRTTPKGAESLSEMARFEGWGDVRILEEA